MLYQKYFGLPIWVWLVIVGIIVFSCYQTMNSTTTKSTEETSLEVETETKEKFAEVSQPKTKIFNFNTSWCGWSIRFQPEWDEFTKRVSSDDKLAHVEVYDIKCDDNNNESMCKDYQVPGYPFVIVETDGKRTQYNGVRTADALVKHVG